MAIPSADQERFECALTELGTQAKEVTLKTVTKKLSRENTQTQ
jgi:hypothetical protein